MPPLDPNEPPDSAVGLFNVSAAMGLCKSGPGLIWPSTIAVIESKGFLIGDEPLGEGATSVVFDARLRVGKDFAGGRYVVKIIKDPGGKRHRDCFLNEVRLLASKEAPKGVVPLYLTHGDVDDPNHPKIQPFLILEKIEGIPIHEYVSANGGLSLDKRLALVERMFEAVHRLHLGNIIHGDPSRKNVFVEPGGVVRPIDYGLGRPVSNVVGWTVSLIGGGTPGAQAEAVLRGEERAAVWSDIHGFAAVGFHALTGVDPEKKPRDHETLRAAGVPADVARVLMKALRHKDVREKYDPTLYRTALDVADALGQLRAARETRGVRKRRLAFACLAACLLAVPSGLGWVKYWGERQATRAREIADLRVKLSGLSHGEHELAKSLKTKAGALDATFRAATDHWEFRKADETARRLIETLRLEIDLRQGLERCLPLREALGEVLAKTRWIDDAPVIASERKRLEAMLGAIADSLAAGRVDTAWTDLGTLHADLARLSANNLVASTTAESRDRFARTSTAISPKLREQAVKDAAHARLSRDAKDAEAAWMSGDWQTADRLFGLALESLDQWLVGKESPEELQARRNAEGGSAVAFSLREKALKSRLEELGRIEQSNRIEIRELKDRIARLTERNPMDGVLGSDRSEQGKHLASGEPTASAAPTPPPPSAPEWPAKAAGDVHSIAFKNQELRFRWCPPDKFLMGHVPNWAEVTLSKGHWTMETEVHQALWTAVMGKPLDWGDQKGDRLPAHGVTFKQAVEFCDTLTEQLREASLLPASLEIRLPTEAEWEYATRAGTNTRFHHGDDSNQSQRYDWIYENAKGRFQNVGTLKPNPWSLYDMGGNVSEWTSERYSEVLAGGLDPVGRSTESKRVIRGGEAGSIPHFADSVHRSKEEDYRLASTGLRPVAGSVVGSKAIPAKPSEIPTADWVGRTAGDLKVIRYKGRDVRFRWCPKGTFQMGSPPAELGRSEEEARAVTTLSGGSWIMETELTQGLWLAVQGQPLKWSAGSGDEYPVYNVSHHDAAEFAIHFTESLREQDLLPTGWKIALPTEAQWERAYRAGTTTRFPFGEDEVRLDRYEWNSENSEKKLHEVKRLKPNPWGLHDMGGNVQEWVADRYAVELAGGTDPRGPSTGSERVERGGDYRSGSMNCRSAARSNASPDSVSEWIGFRLAIVPE